MIRRLGCALLWTFPLFAQDSFATGAVTRFRITLSEDAREHLRREPRTYVAGTVQLGDAAPLEKVGIKLKGSAGSFRDLADRPGLTLKLDFTDKQLSLAGSTKVHLDNSVQDATVLCEWLGAELFAAAGQPAPRVAHAHVLLDGRDLGLYALREGFDTAFLRRAFGPHAERGNLYDGGFCDDVDAELELDSGKGAKDRADLAGLVAACRCEDSDAKKVRKAIEQTLAVEPFVEFAVLEAMLGHWDGYCGNRNNYRVWFDPDGGRARFLPHGMDQLFGDAGASVLAHPPALVADAVLAQPEWRRLYRERLLALVPLFAPERLVPKVRAIAKALHPTLLELGEDVAKAHAAAVDDLVTRLTDRHASLVEQSTGPEPFPLPLPPGKSWRPVNWNAAPEGEGVTVERQGEGAEANFVIALGTPAKDEPKEPRSGTWRTSVLLAKGRYRLTAKARSTGIVPPAKGEDGEQHGGACLCVDEERSERLLGSDAERVLSCEFVVREHQREVELVLKLSGRAGTAWFRADAPLLERLAR